VEDNAGDIGLVREALEQHQVTCALTVVLNGERAIRFIDEMDAGEELPPDMVIVDLNLPRRPGKEVLRRMRASTCCGGATLVVLTSSDSQRDKEDAAQFNPSRYLLKPSRLDEFMELGAVLKRLLHSC
jgi:CheY-like chemotaxis protein